MHERIVIDPGICHGKPVIRGTRIPVAQVIGALAGGDDAETILADYPNLRTEDISAALEFAAQQAEHEYELIAG